MNEKIEIVLSNSGTNSFLGELKRVIGDIEYIVLQESSQKIKRIVAYFPRVGQSHFEYGVFYERGGVSEYRSNKSVLEKIK